MKTHEKQKHLISKILIGLIVVIALFFTVCDCTPKQQPQETVVIFERN